MYYYYIKNRIIIDFNIFEHCKTIEKISTCSECGGKTEVCCSSCLHDKCSNCDDYSIHRCCVCSNYKCDTCFGKKEIYDGRMLTRYYSKIKKLCPKCKDEYCHQCENSFRIREEKCEDCKLIIYVCFDNICSCGYTIKGDDYRLKSRAIHYTKSSEDIGIFYIKYPLDRPYYHFCNNIFISKNTKCDICKRETIHVDRYGVPKCCMFSDEIEYICCKKECILKLKGLLNGKTEKEYCYFGCGKSVCKDHINNFLEDNNKYFCSSICLDKQNMIRKKVKDYDNIIEEHLSNISDDVY